MTFVTKDMSEKLDKFGIFWLMARFQMNISYEGIKNNNHPIKRVMRHI